MAFVFPDAKILRGARLARIVAFAQSVAIQNSILPTINAFALHMKANYLMKELLVAFAWCLGANSVTPKEKTPDYIDVLNVWTHQLLLTMISVCVQKGNIWSMGCAQIPVQIVLWRVSAGSVRWKTAKHAQMKARV
jgi:hypothetical protein